MFPYLDTTRSYAIRCETRGIGDRIPLLTLTGRIPKKKRIISVADFQEIKDLEEFLVGGSSRRRLSRS
jgi:hypothetical protein